MHMRARSALHWGSALGAIALSGAATAQTTEPMAQPSEAVPSSQESAREGFSSDDIIVTAQRRQERLEEVPAAVTVVNAETLANAGVVNLQDLGQVASGTQVGFGGAFTAPAVRGVSTITNGNNFENNVAVYIDGFYEPNTLVINQDLPNLADIQVLKGPQGTLYGRNATGGAILVNTLEPSDTHTGNGEISFGRFEDKRVKGYASGPITDSLRYSLAGYHRHTDGYIKLVDPTNVNRTVGDAAPLRQASLRAKLQADLGEAVTATLGYNYTFNNDRRGLLFSTFEHVPQSLGPVPFPQPPLRPTRFGTAAYNHDTRLPVTSHQGTLKVAFDTGIGTLTTYTGFTETKNKNDFDFDGTYVDLTSSVIGFRQETFQQAADFAIDVIEGLDLVIGGLYYDDKNATEPFGIQSFGPGRQLTGRALFRQDTEAYAVFADGTYQVTDALAITLGGRYSHESKDVFFTSLAFSAANPNGTVVIPPLTRSASFSKFTPRATVRLEIAPRTNVYASYSKGFRSGAFNNAPPAIPSEYRAVPAETIDAVDFGLGRGAERSQ
jgi:iron complex outermembrane recepter protein